MAISAPGQDQERASRVNAQNVKIITQSGKVTLRGPVKSEEEKAQIAKMAEEVACPGNVDNQLEVQPLLLTIKDKSHG